MCVYSCEDWISMADLSMRTKLSQSCPKIIYSYGLKLHEFRVYVFFSFLSLLFSMNAAPPGVCMLGQKL